jgi:O-antigen ligase
MVVLTKNVDLPWGRSNYLAGILLLAFPVALGLMGSAAHLRARLVWLGVVLVTALGLALSASKGAVLAVAIATAFAFLGPWAAGSKWLPRVTLLAVFALVAALFLAGPLKQALEYRMQSSALDYSGSERFTLYRLALEQGVRHPLLGIGINNFSVASHALHGQDTVPHNLELGFFAEIGVPGLVFALAWCAALLASAWRAVRASDTTRGRTLALGAGAAMLGALIHNQVESTIYGEQFKLVLFVLAAALWRLGEPAADGA